MSESDAVPVAVDPKVERTVATRDEVRHVEQMISRAEARVRDEMRREIDKLEMRLKDFQGEVRSSLGIGSGTFAQIRGEVQQVKDMLEGKVSARHAAVNAEVDAKLKVFSDVLNQVAPRESWRKTAGLVVAAVLVVAGPLVTVGIVQASTPDRVEVRELERRLDSAENQLTEVKSILGARGAKP